MVFFVWFWFFFNISELLFRITVPRSDRLGRYFSPVLAEESDHPSGGISGQCLEEASVAGAGASLGFGWQ